MVFKQDLFLFKSLDETQTPVSKQQDQTKLHLMQSRMAAAFLVATSYRWLMLDLLSKSISQPLSYTSLLSHVTSLKCAICVLDPNTHVFQLSLLKLILWPRFIMQSLDHSTFTFLSLLMSVAWSLGNIVPFPSLANISIISLRTWYVIIKKLYDLQNSHSSFLKNQKSPPILTYLSPSLPYP